MPSVARLNATHSLPKRHIGLVLELTFQYRLLDEGPDILGIAVPGMPVGSPGMEVAGVAPVPFDVIAFNAQGSTSIFSSYPK